MPAVQGRARRLDIESLRQVDLVIRLSRLGVPARHAVALVRELGSAATATLEIAPFVSIEYRPAAHLADLDARLREAAERVVPRRRGRPPTRRRGT